MRSPLVPALLLAVSITVSAAGCGDSEDKETSSPSAALPVASPSASASGSYVSQVNALCEAMIDKVMSVRGDEDGDGGGDLPSMEEFEQQELQIRSVHEDFDAEVDAIPVTDADRAAADAFDAFRETGDAEADELLALARSGDRAKYEEAVGQPPSAEFEAKIRAMNEAGIECPAR